MRKVEKYFWITQLLQNMLDIEGNNFIAAIIMDQSA